MTQATQATFTSRTIAVEHIKISSERSFAEVRRRLEGTLPKLDAIIVQALRSGDQRRARDYEETGPKLSIFEERDHGVLLQIFGSRGNALRWRTRSSAGKLLSSGLQSVAEFDCDLQAV